MASPAPELSAFLGVYRPVESEMYQVLEDAAQEAERLIPKLKEKATRSSRLEAASYALILREIRLQQAAMWGDITPILRGGLLRASMAAATAERTFDLYLKEMGVDIPELKASFRAQARRGFEAVLAKGANNIPLSTQVYRTQALATGQVDRVIRRGLVLQLSAQQLANSVRNLIDPDVRGGVSYAAMRLARTEMNNAFHTAAIARYQEPWATGVQWHLSGSHPPTLGPTPEACEVLARANNGLGEGVWPVDQVPAKPHPQCLCYITQQVVPQEEFFDRFLSGEYDEYIDDQLATYPAEDDPVGHWISQQPANRSHASIAAEAHRRFGISQEDAELAVQAQRGEGTNVVELHPKPPTGRAKVRTPEDVPTRPTPNAPPSQVSSVVLGHLDSIIAFTGVHKKRLLRALTRQASFSPLTMLGLRRVRELDREAPSYGEPGLLGEYDERTQTMYLDAAAFQPQAQRTFERELDTGFISKCGKQFDSLDALVAHEYGHHSHDRWMEGKGRGKTWKAIAQALGVPPPSRYDERSVNSWSQKHKQHIENMVSKYGASTVLEMLAEIWAEFTLGDPPRPHIQAIGEILRAASEGAA